MKSGLLQISAERIWMELRKLLAAPDPSRALLWMRTTGVLNVVLPESEKWGIDLVPHLMGAEQKWRWKPDPMLRLSAMMRPEGDVVTGVARRLKFSNDETSRLTAFAMGTLPKADIDKTSLAKTLYLVDVQAIIDRMKLEVARLGMNGKENSAETGAYAERVKFASKWKRPTFPVKGQDLLSAGLSAGPDLGKRLKKLEQKWIDSGFKLTRNELLK